MTELQNSSYIEATISSQHREADRSRSSSAASSSTASSTATRVCACARAREEEQEAAARAAMLRGQYVDCCEYYTASFHRPIARGIQREIATRIKDGMSADVIRAAIDDTMIAPRPSWAYCSAILRNCDMDGVKTLTDWNERKARRQASVNPALQYEQRTYHEDDFGEDFFYDVVAEYGGHST